MNLGQLPVLQQAFDRPYTDELGKGIFEIPDL